MYGAMLGNQAGNKVIQQTQRHFAHAHSDIAAALHFPTISLTLCHSWTLAQHHKTQGLCTMTTTPAGASSCIPHTPAHSSTFVTVRPGQAQFISTSLVSSSGRAVLRPSSCSV